MMVYTSFLWVFVVGLIVGGCVGVMIMALMITAKEADKQMEEYHHDKITRI
jgi:uncharacterized membrane-anchored protein YhcB (DUF1043 family)